MKLFLSSENIGKYPDVFVDMCGTAKSVLYIANAGDYKTPAEQAAKVSEHKIQFENLGLSFTELDLREYFNKEIPKNIFNGHSMVWCSGGNTFLLRAACLLSGFDALLVEAVGTGAVAYGGSSAGAILAGPTLHGAEFGDEPDAVQGVYGTETVWDGLGLVDTVCIPHYESDWFGESAQKMQEALEASGQKYVILRDGQVYVVADEGNEILA